MVEAASPAADGSNGPVQPPDAAQVQALTPESRATIAKELGFRYPGLKAQIDQWYQQTPTAPQTPSEQLGAMFAKGDETGADIDLSLGSRILQSDMGHPPADVAEFLTDMKTNLAALEAPAPIAAAIGEGMIRAANAYEANPEASNTRWQVQGRPTVERLAKNVDGTPATWETVQKCVQTAFAKLPEEFRGEVLKSGALNDTGVVLQLFHIGQRQLAREEMAKPKQ